MLLQGDAKSESRKWRKAQRAPRFAKDLNDEVDLLEKHPTPLWT
jgi:hypothetical protein